MKIVPENKWIILQGHRNSRKFISYLKSLAFLCEIPHFKF
ncbi:transcriptional regulator [Leptospira interrogans serovar Canicola]|nr:transcriptional regulator [Leptospira interrogans serovar Canicola]